MKFKEPLSNRHKREAEILKKYPKIFKQSGDSLRTTCMCWGLDCGEGWYDIIDNLCACIQDYIDSNDRPQVEATQVKEKFGTLRFYTSYHDEYVDGMIRFAEHVSSVTCEHCGSTNDARQTQGGWIKTLCKTCRDE